MAYGIDKLSETYGDHSVWSSELFRIGESFQIDKIAIPLLQAVAANMTIIVKVISNDGDDTQTVATINNTNYPSSEKFIKIRPKGKFKNNFYLQLNFEGSVLLTVGLPIRILITEI